ncbi:Enzyme of Amino Acid Metabolism [Babesia microti strain RI]|uniref:Enzyme of Amino Acid Metabolism n=1 Tax=Babesia microti (strain RI) TaxID=1133968 RepID=I7JDM0_BABMR|nr:Enzyme of Amino Acid Metabolism [Babesia microti strain RI]CCF75895.1 Enzyme of Amino Acid Metabolism [Babesia microti strain RI]|eukprot:XP_012650303.1 Enzyme of Amino Acid Metabolism [Babesia microti strain RI]
MRPEHSAPPEIYYGEEEARKYSSNSRIRRIQWEMAERAVELCLLPDEPCLILDIGCGVGISGELLMDLGHFWIGIDISPSMLDVAIENNVLDHGDLILSDMGSTMRFKTDSFDGAISVSAIQWLCNADKKGVEPFKRLTIFFKWLYTALKSGSRAIFQFYPESDNQTEMILAAAARASFGGGLVVDFPESSKAKKYFLCLWAGVRNIADSLSEPSSDSDHVPVQKLQSKISRRKEKKRTSLRGKILIKKAQQRRKGLSVRRDTKYTGRKRKGGF